jgi:hypothetical protein
MDSKLNDEKFKCLFDQECNICKYTVRIIEKIHLEKIPMKTLAKDLGVNQQDIQELEDAEYCNPHLVIRLCDHLSLEAPSYCPKLKT